MKFAYAFFSICLVVGCANKPIIPSDRWTEDYDYSENFESYLEAKSAVSIRSNRIPYIYIYADWCLPCRKLRRYSKIDPDFAELFTDTDIILLNYDKLNNVEGAPNYGGVPIIVPIEPDGSLGTTVLYGLTWSRSLPKNIKPALCTFFNLRRQGSSDNIQSCHEESS